MKTLYKQCNLLSGTYAMVAWLEADKVKLGMYVTLKDSEEPNLWWKIQSIGDTSLAKTDIKGAHNSEAWHRNDYRRKLEGLIIKGKE